MKAGQAVGKRNRRGWITERHLRATSNGAAATTGYGDRLPAGPSLIPSQPVAIASMGARSREGPLAHPQAPA